MIRNKMAKGSCREDDADYVRSNKRSRHPPLEPRTVLLYIEWLD